MVKFQNVCGSIHYWTKQCPYSYENKTKSKNQSQYALLDCMDILIGKTLNMQLLAWSAPNCV